MSNKSFLEISLYLVSKDSEDDSELASQLWKSLQQFAPETEEERHQRRIDLSHALSVSIRCDDWECCRTTSRSEKMQRRVVWSLPEVVERDRMQHEEVDRV